MMGSLSIEASNAVGGGFELNTGFTPVGVPHKGIDLNGHGRTHTFKVWLCSDSRGWTRADRPTQVATKRTPNPASELGS